MKEKKAPPDCFELRLPLCGLQVYIGRASTLLHDLPTRSSKNASRELRDESCWADSPEAFSMPFTRVRSSYCLVHS
ncbi:hypothetical protein BST61_g3311 [Cercospora zeina]